MNKTKENNTKGIKKKEKKEYQEIKENLLNTASNKQFIFRKTIEVFSKFKKELSLMSDSLAKSVKSKDKHIDVRYSENGDFEAHFKFSGDTLLFIMHTNVFNFPNEHFIYKTKYIKDDPQRSYCGMILIYNFLSDSIKYNRLQDSGFLIGRVFINKDGHFFIQGKRQFSFLYKDFSNNVIDEETIKNIINTAVLYALDFDLLVPPFEAIQEITLLQKLQETGNIALKTSKRLGFTYSAIEDKTNTD